METQNRNNTNDTDDLFDYDGGLDDIHREAAENIKKASEDNTKSHSKPGDAGLGIDEEIKITKKRAPIAKLDEARLLTQAGIPKLRKNAKTKLRFKGKGHEFSDAARLLNFYQLWLDDLYPRAKFADGLTMIEKLGHSKRIQIMRREWIDEGKPRPSYDDRSPSPRMSSVQPAAPEATGADEEVSAGIFDSMRRDSDATNNNNNGNGNGNGKDVTGPSVPSIFGGGAGTRIEPNSMHMDEDLFVSDDENLLSELNKGNNGGSGAPAVEEEDDLDALLAQEDERIKNFSRDVVPETKNMTVPAQSSKDDSFDDDWDAMREYGL